MTDDRSAPPTIPFALALGVTGHRASSIGADPIEAARPGVARLLQDLCAAATAVHARHRAMFGAADPEISLCSALADGADQIVAEEALAQGMTLRALLPLGRDDYRRDFGSPQDAARFDVLLAAAASVIELPGQSAGRPASYALAGRATVAHGDILLALWDGEPARGQGGTAEIVITALRRGRPVIQIHPDPAIGPRILWSGYEAFVTSVDPEDMPTRTADAEAIGELVERLLAPPSDPQECAFLRTYLAEPERRRRMRVEYPLLLALTGTRPMRRGAWWVAPYAQSTREEWATFHATRQDHGVAAALDLIEGSYGWSDKLAQHFAQAYRGGHVLNFLLGALAVLIGLTGLLMPMLKVSLALAELVTVMAFVINTQVGVRSAWHRRWLDYRQLAERLRPMRTLKLLGAAAPDAPPSATDQNARRWVEWYAAGIWRAAGIGSGSMVTDGTRRRRFVVAEEIAPQVRYHRDSAHQLSHLDHRLHALSMVLFAISILSCVTYVICYFVAHDWLVGRASDFVFLSAGLPALGGAIFGIRTQGDFAASATRSLATARSLEAIGQALEAPDLSLAREIDLVEAMAQLMLADCAEWRTAYQQRELELPA